MPGRFRSIGRSTLGDASLSKGCALPLYHRLRFPPISPLVIFLFLPPTAAVTYRIISLLRRSARPPPGDVQPGCAPSDPYPPLGIREKHVGSDPIQISITFFTFFSSNALSRSPISYNVYPNVFPLRNFVPFAASLPILRTISSGISRSRFLFLEFPRESLLILISILDFHFRFNYQRG